MDNVTFLCTSAHRFRPQQLLVNNIETKLHAILVSNFRSVNSRNNVAKSVYNYLSTVTCVILYDNKVLKFATISRNKSTI